MSSSSLAYDRAATHPAARLCAYVELAKPKITALVLLTVAAGAVIGGSAVLSLWGLVHVLLGTALVGVSTSALNQWLERRTDALMPRTAGRPLPSGRLGEAEVVLLGLVTLVAGTVYLALATTLTAAVIAVCTWALYVWVYTPLKTRTTLNTSLGAVGGALPVLIGWAATGRPFSLEVAALAVVVYLWQFPHFMAIAWRYRDEYARAGMKMLPAVDASGQRAGRQALATALALLPVSLLPAVVPSGVGSAGPVFFAWTAGLGVMYLVAAARFFARREDRTAAALLRASLVYLPAVLALWILVTVG